MRVLLDDDPFHALALYDRPYAGTLGVSLYAAALDPLTDPGPRSIEYRRCRILDGSDSVIAGVEGVFALGADSVPKSPRLASVTQPTDEISYPIPAEWQDQTVWAQLRPYAQDYENETIYRPRRIVLDSNGDDASPVLATATVLKTEKRDGGGMLVRFTYNASRDSATPLQFVLTKATGTGTITPGTVAYAADQRIYEIEVTGLTNAVAYTFTLSAETAVGSTDLVTGMAFTGDSAGPPAVTVTVEEW